MRVQRKFSLKSLPSLLALALLPGLGGCGGGGKVEFPENLAFGPETPAYVREAPPDFDVAAWLVDKLELYEEGRLADWAFRNAGGRLFYAGYSRAYRQVETYFFARGYLSLPGFPEHRFHLRRRTPSYVWQGCYREEATGKCRIVTQVGYSLTGAWTREGTTGDYFLALYPPVVGKEGRTDTAWEYEGVYRIPWGYLGPYFYLEDMAYALENRKDQWWGKVYGFKVPFRTELGPGLQILQRPAERAVDLRRLPELDSRPMLSGYLVFGREAWIKGETKDPLVGNNPLAWTNDDYYAFERASGPVTPPYPVCLPGEGYSVGFLHGAFSSRLLPTQGEPHPRIEGVWNRPWYENILHTVFVEEREDPRVAGYVNIYRDPMAWDDVPLYTLFYGRTRSSTGDPPGVVRRLAIYYRFTNLKDWTPDPSQSLMEDRWHVVWSDVRLKGTKAQPDCAVENIGFHTLSWEASRSLDAYFGLENRPGQWYDGLPPYRPVGPILTRFYDNYDQYERGDGWPQDRMNVPSMSVPVPSWALPPGW